MNSFRNKHIFPGLLLSLISTRSFSTFQGVLFCCFLFSCPATVALAEESALQYLLPDTGGTIKSVVVSVNSARRATLRNAELITNIINSLPKTIQFYILTNDRSAFTVARNPWPDRIQFIPLIDDNPITIWPQDPFIVLQGSNMGISFLTSKGFKRADDQVMAREIANYTGYDIKESSFYFEGGNIVSDRDFAFVGANTIRFNAIKMGVTETSVVKGLEAEVGRKILVIGPFPQAVAHIDMMLTPLGEKEVVLADALHGAEIAQKALRENPNSVKMFESYCEQNFFGTPAIQELTDVQGKKFSSPTIIGKTALMIALSKKIAPVLDGIASALQRFGYHVHRVPFLFGGPESIGNDVERKQLLGQASYPMLTYNNVLIESDQSSKIVYLPQYGWQAFDNRAVKAWEKIGYSVRPVTGLTISSMYGGALRCSVKVLGRNDK